VTLLLLLLLLLLFLSVHLYSCWSGRDGKGIWPSKYCRYCLCQDNLYVAAKVNYSFLALMSYICDAHIVILCCVQSKRAKRIRPDDDSLSLCSVYVNTEVRHVNIRFSFLFGLFLCDIVTEIIFS